MATDTPNGFPEGDTEGDNTARCDSFGPDGMGGNHMHNLYSAILFYHGVHSIFLFVIQAISTEGFSICGRGDTLGSLPEMQRSHTHSPSVTALLVLQMGKGYEGGKMAPVRKLFAIYWEG